MVYEYRNYNFSIPAQITGEEMEKIRARDGDVNKVNFLEWSRPETSRTHALFEWDDGIAAEKYRLHQSSQVINHTYTVVEKEGQEKKKVVVRAFVNTTDDNNPLEPGRFVPVTEAINTPQIREVVIRNALRELRSFTEKYRIYSELEPIIKAIDDFVGD